MHNKEWSYMDLKSSSKTSHLNLKDLETWFRVTSDHLPKSSVYLKYEADRRKYKGESIIICSAKRRFFHYDKVLFYSMTYMYMTVLFPTFCSAFNTSCVVGLV